MENSSIIQNLALFITPNNITNSSYRNFIHVSGKETIYKFSRVWACDFMLYHRRIINNTCRVSYRKILKICSKIICGNRIVFPALPLIENIQLRGSAVKGCLIIRFLVMILLHKHIRIPSSLIRLQHSCQQSPSDRHLGESLHHKCTKILLELSIEQHQEWVSASEIDQMSTRRDANGPQ